MSASVYLRAALILFCSLGLVPAASLSAVRPKFIYYGGNTFQGVVAWYNSSSNGVRVFRTPTTPYSACLDAANSSVIYFQQGFSYGPDPEGEPLSHTNLDGSNIKQVRLLPGTDGNNLYVDSSIDLVVWECYTPEKLLTVCWSSLKNHSAPIHRFPYTISANEFCGFVVHQSKLYTCNLLTEGWSVFSIDLDNSSSYSILSPVNGEGGIALDATRDYLYFNDFPFNVVRADVFRLALNKPGSKPQHVFTTTLDYILSLAVDPQSNTLYFPVTDSLLYSVNLSASVPTPQNIASNLGGIDPTVELKWVPPAH